MVLYGGRMEHRVITVHAMHAEIVPAEDLRALAAGADVG